MNCILITNEYPYRNAETFLEGEINYLSNSFEKVIIFSITASDNEKKTHHIPDNVISYPLNSISSRFRYLYFIGRGILTRSKELKTSQKSLKKKLVELYYRGRAYDVYNSVVKVIEYENLDISDVVLYSYWFTYQASVAWLLKKYIQNKGYKTLSYSRAHGYDLYWYRNNLEFLPFQEVALRELDGVFPCSQNGTQYLISKYPNYNHKIHTSYLGTKNCGLNPLSGEDKIVIATCANLIDVKRVDLFAEAFIKIVAKGFNCYWICIGDGECRSKVENIIREAHCEERVTMLGSMTNEDVLRLYADTPITYFCNVSSSEGLPVSIMEAMSFGIPTIATDVGGTSEIVNSKNGRLLNAEVTSEELVEVILQEMQTTADEYTNKRIEARKKWEESFDAERNYLHWIEVLQGKGE